MLLKVGPNITVKHLKMSKTLKSYCFFATFDCFSFDVLQDILNTKSAPWLKKG